jgi:hypothetical protein
LNNLELQCLVCGDKLGRLTRWKHFENHGLSLNEVINFNIFGYTFRELKIPISNLFECCHCKHILIQNRDLIATLHVNIEIGISKRTYRCNRCYKLVSVIVLETDGGVRPLKIAPKKSKKTTKKGDKVTCENCIWYEDTVTNVVPYCSRLGSIIDDDSLENAEDCDEFAKIDDAAIVRHLFE